MDAPHRAPVRRERNLPAPGLLLQRQHGVGQERRTRAHDVVAAYLFVGGQIDHRGQLGPAHVQQRPQRNERAQAVVLPVGADQTRVQPHVGGRQRRHQRQLRADKILPPDAVLLFQHRQHRPHDRAFGVGPRAHNRVELLALQHLLLLAVAEGPVHVRRQVGNHQVRLAFEPDGDVERGAVLLAHPPHQRQRDADPLVLLDAAVVGGLEKREALLLIKRVGLELDARAVDVRGGKRGAFDQRRAAHHRQNHGAVAVDNIDAVACAQPLHFFQRTEALRFRQPLGLGHRQQLVPRPPQEVLVLLRQRFHPGGVALRDARPGVLLKVGLRLLRRRNNRPQQYDGNAQ